MFSSRFMLFPTILENKSPGGGGGGLHFFFIKTIIFYFDSRLTISNLKNNFLGISGGGGGGGDFFEILTKQNYNLFSLFMFSSRFMLFPTILEKKLSGRGGGGAGESNIFL